MTTYLGPIILEALEVVLSMPVRGAGQLSVISMSLIPQMMTGNQLNKCWIATTAMIRSLIRHFLHSSPRTFGHLYPMYHLSHQL
jgi:hypothetical protein